MKPAPGLRGLLSPRSADEFLSEFYGREMLFIAGDPDRFARLAAGDAPGALARQLAYELEAPVTPETVSMCTADGVPLTHGMLALQCSGSSVVKVSRRSDDAPGWQSAFRAGDLLYVPRGWRFAENSFAGTHEQLRFRIESPSGIDLLQWLCTALANEECLLQDVPLFAPPAVQADHLDAMRRTVAGAFRDPQLLVKWTRQRNKHAAPHTGAGFIGFSDLTDSDEICLLASRRPRIRRHSADTIRIPFDGRQIMFPEDAAPLLHFIIDRAPLRAGDFHAHFSPEFGHDELADFLKALSNERLIAFRRPA